MQSAKWLRSTGNLTAGHGEIDLTAGYGVVAGHGDNFAGDKCSPNKFTCQTQIVFINLQCKQEQYGRK